MMNYSSGISTIVYISALYYPIGEPLVGSLGGPPLLEPSLSLSRVM
jgi:hypothetical protein